MPLILKHDLPDRSGRKKYFVHAGALTIGRILEKGLINLPPVRGVVTHGVVDSRDEAMVELRKAWVAWLAGSKRRRSTFKRSRKITNSLERSSS